MSISSVLQGSGAPFYGGTGIGTEATPQQTPRAGDATAAPMTCRHEPGHLHDVILDLLTCSLFLKTAPFHLFRTQLTFILYGICHNALGDT